ncbi:putative secreted aspartic proteinase precursor [Phaeomoniella chlamydospora]|uniref:Putative secreted aspartic proteinase n=1 Tax=Phaeomoniella chlamydospora TaxID=158046 RepID=A0A0G2H9B1_PHACM|nr:putative secreted aspartic proteinase precursor [Phaeomoniella chlamydospora]
MYFSTKLIAVAALALSSHASPLDLRGPSPASLNGIVGQNKNYTTIPQVIDRGFNPHSYSVSGPVVYSQALRKFKAPVPSAASAAAAAAVSKASSGGTGSVAAQPQAYDYEYLCSVQIGTPAQTLALNFDTGSSDLWVFSSLTPSRQVKGQAIYNPSKSSTAKSLANYKWGITYGDGSKASGVVYTDVVKIGTFTINGQAVEAANSVSSSFTASSATNGLLGLGFQNLNTVSPSKQTPVYQTAKKNMTNYLFTANLKKGKAGSYNFGYIDKAQYTGSITYTPVNTNPGYWAFTSSGYAIGSGAFTSASITAIADTGTSLLLLPSSIVSNFYKQVKGAAYSNTYGGYVFPCSTSVPKFTFGVGGYRGVVPGSYMVYGAVNTTHCYGGMQAIAGSYAIFGDVLLKSQFVVFDAGNTRLGFAAKTL